MKVSFWGAMASYAVLAAIAGFALDGKIRLALWILLGGLAIKTCIARGAGW
jgi:hypothetical protein